jgi:hypothetical protein
VSYGGAVAGYTHVMTMPDGEQFPGTASAGEMGQAAEDAGLGEVIVGEIPDPNDLTHMVWTARCTIPAHGLLGTFEDQAQAEQAKERHLLTHQGLTD